METKDMLYIVTEYAKNGEMFGEGRVYPDGQSLPWCSDTTNQC